MPNETVLITGSAGLIGSEAARLFDSGGFRVHGIDNNLRGKLFGSDGDTSWNLESLHTHTTHFVNHQIDIRDSAVVDELVKTVRPNYVLHCAAQPAHEYARKEPEIDFHVNVTGTVNLLDACRKHSPEAPFLFCSSSKVYGPVNNIPWVETDTRFDFAQGLPSADDMGRVPGWSWRGVNERFPLEPGEGRGIYGTGKAAADLLVQEYGITFGMPTVCLRGNCMTGSGHSPAESHGFLAYLARCLMEGRTYKVFGYRGKQVRDVIHSYDFVTAMYMICMNPPAPGTVYNLGGGRESSVSILEAIDRFRDLSGISLDTELVGQPRSGDHRVYISDTSKFRADYPAWGIKFGLQEICTDLIQRFSGSASAVAA